VAANAGAFEEMSGTRVARPDQEQAESHLIEKGIIAVNDRSVIEAACFCTRQAPACLTLRNHRLIDSSPFPVSLLELQTIFEPFDVESFYAKDNFLSQPLNLSSSKSI
jgi:hypothetical protein